MTFIASVVARKGVAIIADSLVTTMEKVIRYDTLMDYFRHTPMHDHSIRRTDLMALFENKPSHTKEAEEKIFEYDRYTAVAVAGSAVINGKHAEYLIREMIDRNRQDETYSSKSMNVKMGDFRDFLDQEVVEHLQRFVSIEGTVFLFTHYDRSQQRTAIYKVTVDRYCSTDEHERFSGAVFNEIADVYKVVSIGQNRLSKRMLLGEQDVVLDIMPKIIYRVFDKLEIDEDKIPVEFMANFMKDLDAIFPPWFKQNMMVKRLTDLTLQQAVDLAMLLMKVEVDFQKYTEDIPTVGGVTKVAIIDNEGFRFIAGHEIKSFTNLN